jgi:hypothetical protein
MGTLSHSTGRNGGCRCGKGKLEKPIRIGFLSILRYRIDIAQSEKTVANERIVFAVAVRKRKANKVPRTATCAHIKQILEQNVDSIL